MVARKQKMDAHLPVDVDRVVDRRTGRARDQDFHGPRTTVREIRARLERPAFNWFQISFVPVRSRRRVERIFWRAPSGQPSNRDCLPAYSSADRFLAHLHRRALFIGRRLRGDSWNSLRDSGLAIRSPPRGRFNTRRRARLRGGGRETTEGVRFELTRPFGLPVFKTGAFNRSATPPGKGSVARSVPRRWR